MYSEKFQEWKRTTKVRYTSFEAYLSETGRKEYECYILDPQYKLSHIESEPLFATDNLGEALVFVHDLHKREGLETCVWQERSQGYREVYRNNLPKRDRKGRFTKEQA